jgi:hypothetical protein
MKPRLLAFIAFALVALAASSGNALIPAIPIPSQPTLADIPSFQGTAARANPIRSFTVPRHPFMAPNGRSNIHNDAYMTDAYAWRGPLGKNIAVTSTWLGIEECASIGFDSHNRIVGLCGTIDGARLRLLDARTLETLNVLPLPPRQYRPGTTPFNDFCAAGYFYLDNNDRAVLSTNTNQVWVVKIDDFPGFSIDKIYDVNSAVASPDCLASVLPDWGGRLWFLSKGGVVGTIDRNSGAVKSTALGEAVANSFAVDETGGVYIVTDHALYRFDAVHGAPHVSWRKTYDRGHELKPGMLSQGSGTSPTLLGDDLVAIADNADPRMNVLVYNRQTGGLVCKEPVFARNASATENSLIAVGRSLIVENNYGYSGVTATANGATTTPGVARVDIDGCRTVWTSKEISPTTVAKASLATGLVYLYTKPARADGTDAWYFTALDLRTGKTAFRKLTGIGYLYNNHYAPISLGPDGAAYIGSLGGLIRIADGS